MAATQAQLDQVETAIIALGNAWLPAQYAGVDVNSIGDDEIDDEGDLVLQPPCVRCRFAGEEFEATKDTMKLTYETKTLWTLICAAEDKRARADERQAAMQLVSKVKLCYAGTRLNLADGGWTLPIELVDVLPLMSKTSVVSQAYALTIRVRALAQFDGPNAQFGVKT